MYTHRLLRAVTRGAFCPDPIRRLRLVALAAVCAALPVALQAQPSWNKDGNSYTSVENNSVIQVTLPAMTKTTLVSAEQLAPLGLSAGERPAMGGRGARDLAYQFSDDQSKVLFLTKPNREYHNTYYSCWVLDRKSGQLKKVSDNPVLNAKLSPDGTK